jgi:DNA-binding XRE family transcriptional regulator/tetratricopeptide (TPR) repeat protein
MVRPLVDPLFPARLRELRQARGLSLRELAQAAYVSKSTLSGLENGRFAPSADMAGHLDRALAADGELARMVTQTPATDPEPSGARSAGAVLIDTVLDPGRPLDGGDVQRLRGAISQLVALENAYGADDLYRFALRVFRHAGRKLACGAYPTAVEADLQAMVGELGGLAAWMLYDADRQDESRRIITEACMVTRLAGDRSVELLQLAHMAMQSVHLRRGREALRVAEHVLDDRALSPRVAGLFQLRRARALAALEDRARSLDALAQAKALIREGTTSRDPAWAWWIDENEMTWHAAMLHADLGQLTRAVDLFQATVRDHPAVGRRQYNNLAHLLDALTAVGAWSDAEPVLTEVLPMVDEIGSTRTERLLGRAAGRIGRAQVPESLAGLAGGAHVATVHSSLNPTGH